MCLPSLATFLTVAPALSETFDCLGSSDISFFWSFLFAAGTTPGSTFFINVNNVGCVFFTCPTFQFKKYQSTATSQGGNGMPPFKIYELTFKTAGVEADILLNRCSYKVKQKRVQCQKITQTQPN
jgi:hypothetical protein